MLSPVLERRAATRIKVDDALAPDGNVVVGIVIAYWLMLLLSLFGPEVSLLFTLNLTFVLLMSRDEIRIVIGIIWSLLRG